MPITKTPRWISTRPFELHRRFLRGVAGSVCAGQPRRLHYAPMSLLRWLVRNCTRFSAHAYAVDGPRVRDHHQPGAAATAERYSNSKKPHRHWTQRPGRQITGLHAGARKRNTAGFRPCLSCRPFSLPHPGLLSPASRPRFSSIGTLVAHTHTHTPDNSTHRYNPPVCSFRMVEEKAQKGSLLCWASEVDVETQWRTVSTEQRLLCAAMIIFLKL